MTRALCSRLAALTIGAFASTVLLPLSAGPAAAAASVPAYKLVDLGANFTPAAVNDSLQVVGNDISGTYWQGEVWQNGSITKLESFGGQTGGLGSYETGGALGYDINDDGVIVGVADSATMSPKYGNPTYERAAAWTASNLGTPSDLGSRGTGVDGEGDLGDPGVDYAHSSESQSVNSSGTVVAQDIGGLLFESAVGGSGPVDVGPTDSNQLIGPCGITASGGVVAMLSDESIEYYATPGSAGTAVPLSVNVQECETAFLANARALAGNNLLGFTESNNSVTWKVWNAATGEVATVAGQTANDQLQAINASGDIVGVQNGSTPILIENGRQYDLSGYGTSNFKLGNPEAIDSNGDIVGRGSVSGVTHGYLLEHVSGDISGTVLKGSAPDRLLSPTQAAAGVAVTISGANGTEIVRTGSNGAYDAQVPGGTYTVTFPSNVCITGHGSSCVSSTSVTAGSDPEPVVNAVQLASPLHIDISTKKATTRLDVTNAGKIKPDSVTVTVKFTNAGKTTLKNIRLTDLRPGPVDPTQRLNQLALKKGTLPVSVGTLAPGKSVSKSFKLEVTGDGKYQWQALATYDDPNTPGGNAKTAASGGVFEVVVPFVFWTANAKKKRVEGGDDWTITGKLVNLSSYQTVCVSPLIPNASGNASAGAPYDIRDESDPHPPYAGALAPGDDVRIVDTVFTDPDGSGRSLVSLRPRITKGETGDVCNVVKTAAEKPVAKDMVKLADDSTDFEVQVYPGSDQPKTSGFAEFFGGYGQGAYDTLAEKLHNGLVLAREFTSWDQIKANIERISHLDPAGAARRAAYAGGEVLRECALTAQYWLSLTSEQRQAFLAQVSDGITEEASETWDGAQELIQQSASNWFDGVVRAYYSGDVTSSMHALGHSVGSGITGFAVDTAEWELGGKLVRSAAGYTRAALAESRVVSTALRGIPVGKLLNFEEMQRLWGLSEDDLKAFSRISKENDVLIGVRGRAPISVANLEEGAVWKHENLKPKNVNAIDVKYLGFKDADSGTVAFRSYSPNTRLQIEKRIAAAPLTEAERKVVRARANVRFNEAKNYLKKIEHMSEEGRIDVGFNYADNGIDRETTSKYRDFKLEKTELSKGNEYYTPLQENPALDSSAGGKLPSMCRDVAAKVLCKVTGDMDGVYLTDTYGRALPEAKRIKVYEELMAAGWQHPETLTWVDDSGAFYFSSKTKILQGLELGGEPMIEFAPDGKQRATYLNLKKSELIGKDVNSYYVNLLGTCTACRPAN